MPRLDPSMRQRVLDALDAGEPIPVDAYLASWQGPRPEAATLAGCVAPADQAAVAASPELAALLGALHAWRDDAHGTVRPDLAGGEVKRTGTILEKEIAARVEQVWGARVVGSSARGVDIAGFGVDIKTTRPAKPQSSAAADGEADLLCGVGGHLVVVVWDLGAGDRLEVLQIVFVPRWLAADHRVTRRAEQLRREVAAGVLSAAAAAAQLEAEWRVPASGPVVAALSSPSPIPDGQLTMSAAFQWRLSYERLWRGARSAGAPVVVASSAPDGTVRFDPAGPTGAPALPEGPRTGQLDLFA